MWCNTILQVTLPMFVWPNRPIRISTETFHLVCYLCSNLNDCHFVCNYYSALRSNWNSTVYFCCYSLHICSERSHVLYSSLREKKTKRRNLRYWFNFMPHSSFALIDHNFVVVSVCIYGDLTSIQPIKSGIKQLHWPRHELATQHKNHRQWLRTQVRFPVSRQAIFLSSLQTWSHFVLHLSLLNKLTNKQTFTGEKCTINVSVQVR